ncbi:glycerol-3-phosphate 1-O-acyltransferase PlsY [Bacillus luti]|nr:glycerol-3-phosphate acyltransferase [Bacillus cereus]
MIALWLFFSYLFGSLPFGVWLGKLFSGKDVRDFGSGNSGATNSFRVLGKSIGIFVLLLDIAKGYVPVYIAIQTDLQPFLLFGLAAAVGHCYPIFAKFRGGKAVSTTGGVVLAVSPTLACIGIISMVLVLLLTRYVSLSSMIGSLVITAGSYYLAIQNWYWFCAFAILIIYRHRSNIIRIMKRTESKIGK